MSQTGRAEPGGVAAELNFDQFSRTMASVRRREATAPMRRPFHWRFRQRP